MSKKILSCLLLAFCVFGLESCKPREKEAPPPVMEQEWYRYVSAFTSGIVSRRSDVRVLFVNNVAETGPAAPGLLEFSPGIDGAAEWKSPRELVFTPKGELKPGREYAAVLHIGKILSLPKALARFAFKFIVIQPQMEIAVDGLFTDDPDRPLSQVLRGRVETADDEDAEPVEKILQADQEGRKLAIDWSHSLDKRLHYFTVKDIERGDQASEVRLGWDGAPIRVDNRGFRSVPVPGSGQFELLSAEAVLEEARHVRLRFSDALAGGQNLKGLIRIEDYPLTFEIEGNVVRAFSSREFAGTMQVSVSPGIRNVLNRRLTRAETREVGFEVRRPQVRFVGKGVILPRKDRLTVPFEAVNLKSVQVTALQVFSNNMAQFLQVNELGGSEEMTRVGRYLWRRTVPLSDDPAVTGRVSRYDLDVTDLFRENPGSLFRLILSFNRGDSTYPCPESDRPVVKEPALRNEEGGRYDRYSNWDYAEDGYGWAQGDWINRNNPCDDAYYNHRYNPQASVGRNFLASDIGLVAKIESNGALHVVATDIGTAQPLTGARVRAFNFQNQLLGEAVSDGSGFAVLKLTDRAFYVSAQSGTDIGYLRVSGNTALQMSHFDVGGEAVEKGIKGAIYGERGVWRPGDTLHLTFVLFDRDRVLPAGHPVSMELYSPQGRLVRTLRPEKIVEPFYAFRAATDEAAPTGNWKARVLVGGLTFSKTLKIETVVPNRLKIDFQAPGQVLTRGDLPFKASVTGQWLHGAPAANLKFDVAVRLSSRPTRFEKYPEYLFDDPAREFGGGEVVTEAGLLDAQGRGRLALDFDPGSSSPGMLEAAFVTRVFEASGDFSIDAFSLPFHPYDSYVGVKTPKGDDARGMLLTDRDQTVDIVTVDAEGRPVSRDGLKVALYKVEWRWWWDRSGESLAQYVASTQTRPLLSGEISTRDGAGRWTFQIRYPDWGRYLVRVEDPKSGHASGRVIYIDWPGWAGRARDASAAGASRLDFTSDKPAYKVGEKATIFLPEAVQGRALVSVENGSSVLQKMWVPTQKGENRFEIALTREMTPNVYIHVTLLQPHRDKVSDTPIRLYGVLPVIVDDPTTRLEPVVQTAEEFRPREKFRVQVRESGGRPMTYTVAVVDEGLLGLTRFATPDLRAEFYKREALGVDTWDLFDEIAEAYGAELARILAIGGDESAVEAGKDRQPRRFPPVVLFAGPFELKAGATAAHEFEMPQYFGAVRVMVVAGRDGAFGSAGKSVPVRRDLMALPTFPRVVRPGERVEMPIAVFVTNPAIKEVTVGLETDALFRVEGESSKTLTFAEPGDEIVTFILKTADAVGQGQVRFRVRGGAESIEDAIAVPVLGA
ncbi:MAG: MG2 domain-containing protein, partial [Candidatus Aminicenantes bacterium]